MNNGKSLHRYAKVLNHTSILCLAGKIGNGCNAILKRAQI